MIDCLWGQSAKTIVVAIARAVDDGRAVRFVHVGGASREENIELPGAALRSSAIQLMGCGIKSVPFPTLLISIRSVFEPLPPPSFALLQGRCPFRPSQRPGMHLESRALWLLFRKESNRGKTGAIQI